MGEPTGTSSFRDNLSLPISLDTEKKSDPKKSESDLVKLGAHRHLQKEENPTSSTLQVEHLDSSRVSTYPPNEQTAKKTKSIFSSIMNNASALFIRARIGLGNDLFLKEKPQEWFLNLSKTELEEIPHTVLEEKFPEFRDKKEVENGVYNKFSLPQYKSMSGDQLISLGGPNLVIHLDRHLTLSQRSSIIENLLAPKTSVLETSLGTDQKKIENEKFEEEGLSKLNTHILTPRINESWQKAIHNVPKEMIAAKGSHPFVKELFNNGLFEPSQNIAFVKSQPGQTYTHDRMKYSVGEEDSYFSEHVDWGKDFNIKNPQYAKDDLGEISPVVQRDIESRMVRVEDRKAGETEPLAGIPIEEVRILQEVSKADVPEVDPLANVSISKLDARDLDRKYLSMMNEISITDLNDEDLHANMDILKSMDPLPEGSDLLNAAKMRISAEIDRRQVGTNGKVEINYAEAAKLRERVLHFSSDVNDPRKKDLAVLTALQSHGQNLNRELKAIEGRMNVVTELRQIEEGQKILSKRIRDTKS